MRAVSLCACVCVSVNQHCVVDVVFSLHHRLPTVHVDAGLVASAFCLILFALVSVSIYRPIEANDRSHMT